MYALCKTVSIFILQKQLVLTSVYRNHADAVFHRIRALTVYLLMNDNNVLYIRIVHIDAVHKKQRRVGISRIIHNHLRRQHGFIEISKIFIDMSQFNLVHNKPFDCNAVALFQVRVFILVADDIGIQKRVPLIVQAALICKVHQHHFGYLYIPPDVPILVKLQRHHIILIQPGHPHRMFHAKRIPWIVIHPFFVAKD